MGARVVDSPTPSPSSRAGGRPIDALTGRPPVFLVGPARSGTSLIYKLLCLHPQVAYISNWLARYPELRGLAALNRIPRLMPSKARGVWFGGGSNAYVYGHRRPLRDRLFPMPVEGEPVFRSCGLDEAGRSDTALTNGELRRAVASIVRSSGGPTFVNKRIANNRRIPTLARAFPSARFVSIVRDGRAVAYSLSRVDWWEDSVVWWYGDTPRRWREEGRDPWELCARNWVEELSAIEGGIGEVPGDRVLRLSYEDFVRDPLVTLDQVRAFAGLSADVGWLRGVRSLRYPDRNEGWRQALDARAVDTITTIQATKLEAYGYAA